MTILDRYIIWNFTKLFIMTCILLVSIFVVFDIVDNFDNFFGKGPFFETFGIICKYYLFHTFMFLDILLSFMLICAAIALLRGMDQGNEIIALMASGVSRVRILAPLFGTAFFFACCFFIFREVLIPMNLTDLVKTPEDYFRPEEAVRVCKVEDQVSGLRFSGDLVFTADHKITQPVITLPPELSKDTNIKIAAENAFWMPGYKGLKQGILLKNIKNPANFSSGKSLYSPKAQENVILTSNDYPQLLQPDECYMITAIPFELLQTGIKWSKYTSVKDLVHSMNNKSLNFDRHKMEIEIHSRILRPITDIIPFFICIPLIFFRNSKNMAKNILFGIFLTFVYIGFQFVTVFLGSNLDSTLSSWLPILVFAPIGFAIFYDLIISPKILLTKLKRKNEVAS